MEILPFSTSGTPELIAEFKSKEAVLGYLSTIIDNFIHTVLVDKELNASDDGSIVIYFEIVT